MNLYNLSETWDSDLQIKLFIPQFSNAGILSGIEKRGNIEIYQTVRNEAVNVATNLLTSLLRNTIPGVDVALNTLNGESLAEGSNKKANVWEAAITDTLCNVIKSQMPSTFRTDAIWFEPSISFGGMPIGPGVNPLSTGPGCGGVKSSKEQNSNQPELIIKNGPPTDTSTKSFTLVEVKVNVNNKSDTGPNSQFQTFVNYADISKQRMWVPNLLYVGLKRISSKTQNKLEKSAIKKGVLVQVIDFGL